MLDRSTRSVWFCSLALGALLLAAGCGPKYPKCDADKDCHQGEFCVNGLCQQCRSDQDCPAGQSCASGACQAIPGFCNSNSDCGPGQQCQNNRCVAQAQQSAAPPPPDPVSSGPCTLDAVYFDYDSSNLDQSSRDKLSTAAACIKQRSIKAVHVTGMTDPRGTEEYNLALGDRRAQSAKKYLQSLGIQAQLSASSMGEEQARGTDESGWSRDRRADLQEK
jgi:peptidoglycan-associated lipoprotein